MQFTMLSILLALITFMFGCAATKPIMLEESTSDGQVRYSVIVKGKEKLKINEGLYTAWYPNGTKKTEVNYVAGLKQGTEILWDAFGIKLRETKYDKGLKQGKEIHWDTRGRLKREVMFLNDLQEGPEIT